MIEIEQKELAEKVARDIMAIGDEPNSKAQRLQYMGGEYPDNEKKQGGLCENALADVIEESLHEHNQQG